MALHDHVQRPPLATGEPRSSGGARGAAMIRAEADALATRLPATMRVEITKLCNERCVFCPYTHEAGRGREMTLELYERILEQHLAGGGEKILFPSTLGEPTLAPNLPEWVALARAKGYREVHTFTNASRLHADLSARLIDAGITGVMFTLHGLTETSFKRLTGFAGYDRVVENILGFLSANDAAGRPSRNFLTIYSEHAPSFVRAHEVVRAATGLGATVAIHGLGELHNWGGTMQVGDLPRSPGAVLPCRRLWTQFGVAWNGDVVLCCCDHAGAEPLGNVLEHDLAEILGHGRHRAIRDAHLGGADVETVELCAKCTTRDVQWTALHDDGRTPESND
jgi:pyruvate-formate lyase-activating enzyme